MKRLLFAMLCIVSALGMRAQTWTAPTIQGEDPVSGGKYTIYNVGAGMFINGGKAWFSWSTTAILASTGLEETFTGDAASFTLKRADGKFLFTSGNNISGDAMHVDGGNATNYGLTKLNNGNYRIHDAGGNESSPCWGYNSTFHATGVVAHADATAEGWNCEWIFIGQNSNAIYNARLALYNWYLDATEKGVDASAYKGVYDNASATIAQLNEASNSLKNDILQDLLAKASNDNPQDITKYVLTNADFSAGNINGWETNYVSGQQANNIGYQGASYSNGDVVISQFIEAWKPGAVLGDGYLRQTVQGLPEGKFVLSADAIATWQNDDSRVITGAQLYIQADGVTYKTDMSTKNGKPQHFTTEFLNTGEGDVIFGLRTVSATCNWMCADNFKVTFYGIDLSPYATLLAQAVAEAEALQGSIPTAAYTTLEAVVTANNKTYETSKEYTTAIATIQQATEEAKKIQTSYSKYQTLRSTALGIAENTDFTEADAAANNATTIEAIDAAIVKLRAAFLAELPNVTVPEGGLDITAVMVENPSVSQGVEGWTITDVVRMDENGTGPTTNYGETEFYRSNFKIYQTLALTSGTWEFGVTGFHRAGNHSTYFYAGEDKILIPGVESTIVNSMADAKTYFDNGNGKVALKFLIEEAKDVEIGIDNKDTETDRWTIFRDFTLKYYGAPDYSVYDQQWAEAVEAANNAKTTNTNVTGDELTALNNALANEPVSGDKKAQYLEKIQALQDATQTFTAAAPSYNAYAAEKVNADMLGVEATAPTTAAEAAAMVNTLKVAEYNKVVADYPYSLTSKIGEFSTWTMTATSDGAEDTPQTLSNEHWSGATHTYYEQGKNGWAANSFTVTYTKTTTLPAGEYVIKVAARASANVNGTISATATENTVALPNVGAATKGIDKSGAANFGDGEFANNGTNPGYGWEWRYLPFTLTEETEVTITINAASTSQHGWVSIADGELLSANNIATAVEYDEAATNTIEDVEVANVTITRNVKVGLNTVVLPFDLTEAQVNKAFGTGAEVYAFSENSTDANNATVNFNKVAAGTITANVPVLVKATVASTEQVFNGVEVKVAAEATVAGTNFDFVGVYAPMTVAEGDYFVSGDKLYKSAGATNLKAFRAYIQNKGNATGEVKLYIDGVATAISEINADVQESGVIYNLAGQRVSKATRGIYVKNGRKVVVK